MPWLKHRRDRMSSRHSTLSWTVASTNTNNNNNNDNTSLPPPTDNDENDNDKETRTISSVSRPVFSSSNNTDSYRMRRFNKSSEFVSPLHTIVSRARGGRPQPGSATVRATTTPTTTTTTTTTTTLLWILNVIGLLACWTIAVFRMPALDHSSSSGDDVRLMTLESFSSSSVSSFQLVLRNPPSNSGGTTTTRTRRRHHHIREDDNLSHQLVVYLTDSQDMVPSLQEQSHHDTKNVVVVVGPSMMMMNRGDADYNNLTITFFLAHNTTNNNLTRNNTLATININNNSKTTSPPYVEFPTRLIVSDDPPLGSRHKSRTQQRRDTKHRHLDDDCYELLSTRHKPCESSHVAKAMEFPVCNLFHERSVPHSLMQSPKSRFVGEGSFRQTLVMDQRPVSSPNTTTTTTSSSSTNDLNHSLSNTGQEVVVLKFATFKGSSDYTKRDYLEYRQDGVIYAATGPHPLLVDLYGYCSLGLLSEYMEGGSVDDVFGARQRCDRPNTTIPLEYTTATNNSNVSLAPLDNQETVYSISPLTALEKLYFALDMAQAVALLHNNRYGVIVHDDIWLAQFLLSSPRHTNSTNTWLGQQRRPPRIKLNDFNRAEAMMYNYEEKRYCKYQNGKGNEDWRSPEEYFNNPLDEMIDIFSLGNNFYTLLTGEFVFPNTCRYRQVQDKLRRGERSFLDPRWANVSHAEGQLVHVIQKCWEQEPQDRYRIEQVITVLEQALEKQLQLDKTKMMVKKKKKKKKKNRKDGDDPTLSRTV